MLALLDADESEVPVAVVGVLESVGTTTTVLKAVKSIKRAIEVREMRNTYVPLVPLALDVVEEAVMLKSLLWARIVLSS
jgi:hypothetical protein